ncbi:hypothetical protein PTTG_00656 [Puccinia triticina 1-1 BBBD Race 1]|uniref:Uncharacterized protein n=1 Tax=Puccinia triticina (isolate 1-1 / race 1 (BBBD)) TaxID=630390 RepID=A0A180FZU1_PUCT1|nr:hypothetical protein PTTG_00656 [Puccinia triticina 1-1 BBBD Race 1]
MAKSSESANVQHGCYQNTVNQNECKKCILISFELPFFIPAIAIATIKLDRHDRLPPSESEVRTISGSCSLVVFNKKLFQDVTMDQITQGLATHFKNCPNKAGFFALPGNEEVMVQIKTRAAPGSQWNAWNADAELNKPYCFKPKGDQDIASSEDCIAFFIHTPPRGFQISSGSCTVIISTTDGSVIKMNKKDSDSAIIAMMKECGKLKLPGVVNVKGAEGPNGKVFVQTIHHQN